MAKIVIASDSFKGCLSSAQVACAARKGILSVCPGAEVYELSVSDGGEGLLSSIPGLEVNSCDARDPLGRIIRTRYGVSPDGTAVIESASATGLGLLPQPQRNPLLTSSHGVGDMIMDAVGRGYRKFLIGLGGTSTNDSGTGMLQAMGWRFYDSGGELIERCCGGNLSSVARVCAEYVSEDIFHSSFRAACDVDNPLYGPEGAAAIFAPQKGAGPEEVFLLDEGLKAFARLTGGDPFFPCAGAAGGIAFAIRTFLGGKLEKGVDVVLDAAGFDTIAFSSDMVITGEGRLDTQTSYGKVPYGVLIHSRKIASQRNRPLPVVAVCGGVSGYDGSGDSQGVAALGFDAVIPVSPSDEPLSVSMSPSLASERITAAVKFCLSDICPLEK